MEKEARKKVIYTSEGVSVASDQSERGETPKSYTPRVTERARLSPAQMNPIKK